MALGTAVGFVVIDKPFLSLGSEHRATALALLGLLVGAGAMLAELPNSFLKRRMGIAPGAQAGGIRGVAFHVLDQIDVVFGAWAFMDSACRQDSNVDTLLGTGAQGRLIRRKSEHPAFQARTAFALAIFVGLRSGTWPRIRRIQWLV